MTKIDITGLDKADVLAALYNAARTQGIGLLHYRPGDMTSEEARQRLEISTSVDYLRGRVLKVNLSGDSLCPFAYDRDNGQGAAERVIDALRAQNKPAA